MCEVMQRVVFVLNTTNQVRCKMNIKYMRKSEYPSYVLKGSYQSMDGVDRDIHIRVNTSGIVFVNWWIKIAVLLLILPM